MEESINSNQTFNRRKATRLIFHLEKVSLLLPQSERTSLKIQLHYCFRFSVEQYYRTRKLWNVTFLKMFKYIYFLNYNFFFFLNFCIIVQNESVVRSQCSQSLPSSGLFFCFLKQYDYCITTTHAQLFMNKSAFINSLTLSASSYQFNMAHYLQDAAVAAEVAMLPTFWVASFFAWWACSTATASSTCVNTTSKC